MSVGEKKRSRFNDLMVYAAVRGLVCVLQAMSFSACQRFAAFLGWVAYQADKRHREVARENLEKAFPGRYSAQEIDAIVRAMYVHFCRVLIEIIHIPRRFHFHNYKNYVCPDSLGPAVDALLSDRPLFIVTGHHGNWEMAGYSLGLFGFTTHAIARTLDNPYLDRYLREFRERTGQRIIAKQGEFDLLESRLRNGGVIATLADQDAGQRGQFVDFFGRPASTHKAVALLALEHKVPMMVVSTFRQADGRYVIRPASIIDPLDYERTPDAIKQITQRFTSDLEKLIREAPEQYFWLHRRWKHQPQKRAKKQAA